MTKRVLPSRLSRPSLHPALDPAVLERHPALAAFAADLGGTPLVSLPRRRGEARILAKCEWENPTGSIKDRTAFAAPLRPSSARARAGPGARILRRQPRRVLVEAVWPRSVSPTPW